jgi:hypothetical protein
MSEHRYVLDDKDKTIQLIRCEKEERIKNMENNYTNELNQV